MGKGSEDVQRLVTNRFKQVVDKVREVTGRETINSQMLGRMLVSEMYQKVPQVIQIESRHRDALENLAIEACLEDTQIPSDWFIVEANLNREIYLDCIRIVGILYLIVLFFC